MPAGLTGAGLGLGLGLGDGEGEGDGEVVTDGLGEGEGEGLHSNEGQYFLINGCRMQSNSTPHWLAI